MEVTELAIRSRQDIEQHSGMFDGLIKDIQAEQNPKAKAGLAAELLEVTGIYLKAVHREFDPACDSAYQAWQEALALRKKFLSPAEAAEKFARKVASDWALEVAQRQEEKRRELERQQKEQQEAERQAQIQHAIEQGRPEEAKAIAEAPLPPPPLVVPDKSAAKLDGVSVVGLGKAVYKVDPANPVSDLDAFIDYVAANKKPCRTWILPALSQINRGIEMLALTQVPGLRVGRVVETRRTGTRK